MNRVFIALALCVWAGGYASAATVGVDVRDSDGKPVPNAVVTLDPNAPASVASHVSEKAVIDQREETFIPFVVVVRRGGHVVFTNNDATMHQVYSFSPIRQFQFVIRQGEISAPIVFEHPGVAAIGCNIHDMMIAYVYVADAPFAAVTDGEGHASIHEVPDGGYRVNIWHPQLPVGTVAPSPALAVSRQDARISVALPFAVVSMRGMKHMHMDY